MERQQASDKSRFPHCCPRCGRRAEPDYRFCPSCGRVLDGIATLDDVLDGPFERLAGTERRDAEAKLARLEADLDALEKDLDGMMPVVQRPSWRGR